MWCQNLTARVECAAAARFPQDKPAEISMVVVGAGAGTRRVVPGQGGGGGAEGGGGVLS